MSYRQTKQQCAVYCEVLQEKGKFFSFFCFFVFLNTAWLGTKVPKGWTTCICHLQIICWKCENVNHRHNMAPKSRFAKQQRSKMYQRCVMSKSSGGQGHGIPEVSLWQAPNLGTVLREPYLHSSDVTRKSAAPRHLQHSCPAAPGRVEIALIWESSLRVAVEAPGAPRQQDGRVFHFHDWVHDEVHCVSSTP